MAEDRREEGELTGGTGRREGLSACSTHSAYVYCAALRYPYICHAALFDESRVVSTARRLVRRLAKGRFARTDNASLTRGTIILRRGRTMEPRIIIHYERETIITSKYNITNISNRHRERVEHSRRIMHAVSQVPAPCTQSSQLRADRLEPRRRFIAARLMS
jgi:hypothetical protein